MILYNIIENKSSKNIDLFINKDIKSEHLFNLLSNDKSINYNYFGHSTNIIINNDFLECYYTNFNEKDKFYITKLTFDIKTRKINVIDIIDNRLGIIPYNFKLITLNNNILMIGGHHPEVTNYYISNCYKGNYETFYDKRFIGHPHNYFISYNSYNKYHVNGLYIQRLEDLHYYKDNNLPIIHLKSKHENYQQNIDFDSKLSIIFNDKTKKYIICTRSNIKSNTRFISYSSSKDLINWETFKYLDLKTDFDKDNYYYSSIFNYHDVFIGFPLYSKWSNDGFQNNKIKIIASNSDFLNWQDIGVFKLNNMIYDSIIVDVNFNNELYDEIFEHTNHCCNKVQSIISHKFPKYSIIGIKNKENLIGVLTTIPIILNIKNTLHAIISENGFIDIEFSNIKYSFLFSDKKPYIFNCNNLHDSKILKITFKNAKLFAII